MAHQLSRSFVVGRVACLLLSLAGSGAGTAIGQAPELAGDDRFELRPYPEVDESAFLLYSLNWTYASWPQAGSDPAVIVAWVQSTRRHLQGDLQPRAVAAGPRIDSLLDDCLMLLDRYEQHLRACNIIDDAAAAQASEDAWFAGTGLGVDLLLSAAGGPPALIVTGIFAVGKFFVSSDHLDEAHRQVLEVEHDNLARNFEQRITHFRKVAAKVQAELGWPAGELDFDGVARRARDPFARAVELAQSRARLADNRLELDGPALLAEYASAVRWVPGNEAYRHIRARILLEAARLANDIAEMRTSGSYSRGSVDLAAAGMQLTAAAHGLGASTDDAAIATRLGPLLPVYLIERGRALACAGTFEEAGSLTHLALLLDSPYARPSIHRYRAAAMQCLAGNLDDAQRSLRTALQDDPRLAIAARSNPDFAALSARNLREFLGTTYTRTEIVRGHYWHDVKIVNDSDCELENVEVGLLVYRGEDPWGELPLMANKTFARIPARGSVEWRDAFTGSFTSADTWVHAAIRPVGGR